jgi:hypothetical protein
MKNRGRVEWYEDVCRQQNNGELRSCEVQEHGSIRINWSDDVNTEHYSRVIGEMLYSVETGSRHGSDSGKQKHPKI